MHKLPKTLIAISLFLCLITTGCGKIQIDWVDNDDAGPTSNFPSVVAKTLDDRSKDECLYLYRFFDGIAEYVQVNHEEIGTTDRVESLIEKVHKQNGWLDSNLKSKDEDFTKTLTAELTARKFAEPKSLDDVETLNALVKILNETAEGAHKAYKRK